MGPQLSENAVGPSAESQLGLAEPEREPIADDLIVDIPASKEASLSDRRSSGSGIFRGDSFPNTWGRVAVRPEQGVSDHG